MKRHKGVWARCPACGGHRLNDEGEDCGLCRGTGRIRPRDYERAVLPEPPERRDFSEVRE